VLIDVHGNGVLRIALGAPQSVDTAETLSLQVETAIVAKISLITQHWQLLSSSSSS